MCFGYIRYIVSGGFFEVLTANTAKNVKRRRTPEQKHGRYKWIKTLINRNSHEIREIKRMLRGLSYGLSYLMDFDSEYLVSMVCRDSRDRVILDVLCAAGPDGLSPKTIHAKVRRYGLKYHHISRRIKRMNKRMQSEIGERVADKVGRNWALSDFMLQNWSAKTNEIEVSGEQG
ncbi:MAG: hypothetical protein OEY95_01185 [Candidatus Bathyarchaeota archaeon]|nr:hypothetical protein [Candidatus Bathyarchaeota archaeon]